MGVVALKMDFIVGNLYSPVFFQPFRKLLLTCINLSMTIKSHGKIMGGMINNYPFTVGILYAFLSVVFRGACLSHWRLRTCQYWYTNCFPYYRCLETLSFGYSGVSRGRWILDCIANYFTKWLQTAHHTLVDARCLLLADVTLTADIGRWASNSGN